MDGGGMASEVEVVVVPDPVGRNSVRRPARPGCHEPVTLGRDQAGMDVAPRQGDRWGAVALGEANQFGRRFHPRQPCRNRPGQSPRYLWVLPHAAVVTPRPADMAQITGYVF